MIELTAVFEAWHLGDGNYPPLDKGMLVNLSFHMDDATLALIKEPASPFLEHLGNAEYRFCAEILRIYDLSESSGSLVILTTGDFRFYVETFHIETLPVGARVTGTGTLLLDYYIWVEFLTNYPDPPDLFYTLEVTRIRRVTIPEHFIQRSDKGMGSPTRVSSDDFGKVVELETMKEDGFDFQFYLVDFRETRQKDVPKTFI